MAGLVALGVLARRAQKPNRALRKAEHPTLHPSEAESLLRREASPNGQVLPAAPFLDYLIRSWTLLCHFIRTAFPSGPISNVISSPSF